MYAFSQPLALAPEPPSLWSKVLATTGRFIDGEVSLQASPEVVSDSLGVPVDIHIPRLQRDLSAELAYGLSTLRCAWQWC